MRSSNITVSIYREGTFAVHWTGQNQHQCGNIGTRILGYRVRITAPNDRLDHRGFILDNQDIPEYFERVYQPCVHFESCETVAQRAVNDLLQLFVLGSACATQVYTIDVEISGIPGSWIGAHWSSEECNENPF